MKNKTKAKHGSLKAHFQRFWPYYLMVAPGVIYMIIFKYIPMAGSIIAFENFNLKKGVFGSDFVGLANFAKLFRYDDFYKILRNTLLLSVLKVLIVFPIPVIFALMLNEIRLAGLKKGVQTIICIPHFISWVVVGGLVFDLFSAHGLFNNIRALFGLAPILAMQKEAWFRPIYVFSSIWKEAGWGTVVYLAAIAGIDPTLYESASMDGANRFQRMTRITFPVILPTIVTMFLLNIGGFLDLGFEQVYNLQTPMTYNVSDIFDTYVYRAGILQAQYSYTTAVGLFQSVIGLVLVVTFNKLANKFTEDGGLW